MARQAETQAKEGKMLRKEEQSELNRVLRSQKNKIEKKNSKEQYENKNKIQKDKNCGRCGRTRHEDFRKGPALKATCHNCQKIGHWNKVCRSKKVRRVDGQESDEDSDKSTIFLGTVREDS